MDTRSARFAIRRHLKQRQVGPHVIEGGLSYLVTRWERLASEVDAVKRQWLWEEWLNDLDVREIIQDLFDNVPESRIALDVVERADKRFASATIPTDECQWGDYNAERHGWTPDKNWWYWCEPPTPYEA